MSRTNPNGSLDTVALAYESKLLNSPNDVICVRDGDIIFTDPPYGLLRPGGSFGAQDIPFQGIYRVSASDGSIELLAADFDRPNGLVMTDDGRRLYVAAGDGRESGLGRRGLADAVRDGDELGISTSHEGRGPAVLASGLMGYLPFCVVVDEQQVRPASLGLLDSDGCSLPTTSNGRTEPVFLC